MKHRLSLLRHLRSGHFGFGARCGGQDAENARAVSICIWGKSDRIRAAWWRAIAALRDALQRLPELAPDIAANCPKGPSLALADSFEMIAG